MNNENDIASRSMIFQRPVSFNKRFTIFKQQRVDLVLFLLLLSVSFFFYREYYPESVDVAHYNVEPRGPLPHAHDACSRCSSSARPCLCLWPFIGRSDRLRPEASYVLIDLIIARPIQMFPVVFYKWRNSLMKSTSMQNDLLFKYSLILFILFLLSDTSMYLYECTNR